MARFGIDWYFMKRLRDKYGLAVRFGVTASRATPLQKNLAEKETPVSYNMIFVQIFRESSMMLPCHSRHVCVIQLADTPLPTSSTRSTSKAYTNGQKSIRLSFLPSLADHGPTQPD